jgi:hypothetical protein
MPINIWNYQNFRGKKPAATRINQLIRLPKLAKALKGIIHWSLREWGVLVDNEFY